MGNRSISEKKQYIERWTQNAQQHFADGDYEWLGSFVKSLHPLNKVETVLEIGCGAGYSTLVFALLGFRVVSIDVNECAIEVTKELIESNDYSVSVLDADTIIEDEDVSLLRKDIIEEFGDVAELVIEKRPVDLVVLCNPGGQYECSLSKTEYLLLRQHGWSEQEIQDRVNSNQYPLLHKWAFIYAACRLTQEADREILIVERGSKMDIEITLGQIASDMAMRRIRTEYRRINHAPENGIQLGNASEEIYWGAALYFPS